ncbi:hypothetical protein [Dongia sp. agr-C8]
MQFLIDFAAEDQEFRGILERASKYPTVQGVVLDIERFWLATWQLRNRWGDNVAEHDPDDWLLWRLAGRRMPAQPYFYPRPLRYDDLESWRPQSWQWFRRDMGFNPDGLPLVVKVCLRPQKSPDEPIPSATELRSPEGRLAVEVETRPQGRLSSNPRKPQTPLPGGVSIGIGATDYGTLSVVLKDAGGQRYAVTCAHVAAQANTVQHPAPRDSSKAAAIGTSILASTLAPCLPGQPCNPWSGVQPNSVDLSLIKIDASRVSSVLEVLDIGSLGGIAPRANLSTGQTVEVMARTSRYNQLQVGGLAAWYKFNHAGVHYCFQNLFEVESPYGTAGIIKSGDSGAPVCTPDASGTAWAGMIIGADSFKGYAVYAETMEAWIANQGYRLRVS